MKIRVSILERSDRMIKIHYTFNGMSRNIIVQPNIGLTNNLRNNRKVWKERRKSHRMVCPIQISNQKLQLIQTKVS